LETHYQRSEQTIHRPIRIAGFHVEPDAYQMVADWAEHYGHELALVVTTPGPARTDYDGHIEIVTAAPRSQDVLVTTRLTRAAAAIAAYEPDVILSYTFPYRLPESILTIPRLGAVNLHPSPLPRYRGPNAHRMLYDGGETLGATLHRTATGFDTGPILSRREVPLPLDLSVESVSDLWNDLLCMTLNEGMEQLIAGEPGVPQDEEEASYAASFTPEEHWLDWRWPAAVLQRRTVALNLLEPTARALLGGDAVQVLSVRPVAFDARSAGPGTVIAETGDCLLVAAGDGVVEVELLPDHIPAGNGNEHSPQLAARVAQVPAGKLSAL
jgi:methionyl-tRNA formyltransferase